MKKILRFLLPSLLVVAAVWLAVIVWWRVTNRLPDGIDVVLWLVVLPVGLLLGYWLLKKFFDVLKRLLSGLLSGAAVSQAAPGTESVIASSAAEQARGYVLHVLGGGVCLPHADSISAVCEKLAENEFAPTADTQLQDEQGKPLLVTAIPELDVTATRTALQNIDVQDPRVELTPRLLRSVTIAAQVLEQTLRQLEPWVPGVTPLQVMCMLPLAWSDKQRAVTATWVRQQLLESGWPKERLTVSVITTQAEAEVLTTIDRCNEMFNQQQGDQIGLLLAMDSWLDAHAIAAQPTHWFSARNIKGVVPGEGAAAVLFCRAECVLQPPPESESVTALHRAALGRRDKAASAGGHISAELLKELARQCMQVAQIAMVDAVRALTDVDHRGGRLQEVANAMSSLQAPEADPVQLGCVGASMGQVGAATTIAALLAAHHTTINEHKPVLLLSAPGDYERAAAVVKPLPAANISA